MIETKLRSRANQNQSAKRDREFRAFNVKSRWHALRSTASVMEVLLLVQALGYGSIGIVAGTLIGILLVCARREHAGGGSLAGRVHLILVLAGLCGFIALSTVLLLAKR